MKPYANTDTRFAIIRANRPFDDAPCVQVQFLDKPHKRVKDTLKSFATESGARMFGWDSWNGVWYATEKAIGDNLPNICAALTQALDEVPAKKEKRTSATDELRSEMAQMREMFALMMQAMASAQAEPAPKKKK